MKSLNLTKPHLIIIVGIPGAGKTYFGQQFSNTFNAPYLTFDDISALTTDDSTAQKVWDYTISKIIQTKQTLLIEGPGTTRAERQTISSFARTNDYQPLFIWVQTEPNTAQLRSLKGLGKEKHIRPLTKNEFAEQFEHFQPLTPADPYIVISGKHTYASQAKNVLKKLTEPRVEKAAKMSLVSERPAARTVQKPTRQGRIAIN